MEKVVTINLGGNAYQLDEPAYAAVQAYLTDAAHALRTNPDKDEIVADLEAAIAHKADTYLGPHKSVIGASDMDAILKEMGTIEDEGGEEAAQDEPNASASTEQPRDHAGGPQGKRRLYRLPDGAMIAGVCNGLGAHFSIDPAIVRVLFIIAAVVTHGFAIIGYVVLMFVIPAPVTPEEWAKAHNAPFNAQDVIERAKSEYQTFAEHNHWSGMGGRRAARRARRAARRARRVARAMYWPEPPNVRMETAPGPVNTITRGVAGSIALVAGLFGAALTILLIVIFFSLISTNAILGWTPPGNLPGWAILLIALFGYFTIMSTVSAIRRAASRAMYGRRYSVYHAFDGIVWMALFGLAAWLAYLYVPQAHDWIEQFATWAQAAWDSLLVTFQR
jgi:phage shock protein PspC (stress-responsive transcriptional regulator)